MSAQDENQVLTNEVQPEAPAETKELSFAEELAAANDKTTDEETPETPVEEVAKPVEEEQETPGEQKPEIKPEDETPVETEAERKQRFYEMRQQLKQEKTRVEESIRQQYQPQDIDEIAQKYIEQGYSQFEAESLARDDRRDQQAQIDTASVEVAKLNMSFGVESLQVMHDFPIFDPNSDEYKSDGGAFAARAARLFESHAGVKKDPKTGSVLDATETPYNFYKELAEMRGSGISQAQIQAQKAAEQQMASVAPPVSNRPESTVSKDDAEAERLKAAFDKV